MKRKIEDMVQGFQTQDGAGVKLVRVLGNTTAETYDPILMLDSFDSHNPEDYRAGFPMHPHRGIETISYIYKGKMSHRDSLGNQDTITDGEVQWMSAGSGIMHEEVLPDSERLLGVQLWLNLPKKDKMSPPKYKAIKRSDIQEIPFQGGYIRLLAGKFQDKEGYMSDYLPLDYYDIHLEKGGEITIETPGHKSIMVFTLLGSAQIEGKKIPEKTAAKLTQGDSLSLKGLEEDNIILFISSDTLEEPIFWGGPIVMASLEDLQNAFDELNKGTFIKDRIEMEES